jgi:hypothetical protein
LAWAHSVALDNPRCVQDLLHARIDVFRTKNAMSSFRLSPVTPNSLHSFSIAKGVITEVRCLEYARECVRRAKLVTNPELRGRLFNIARTWTERATREPSDAIAPAQANGTHNRKAPSMNAQMPGAYGQSPVSSGTRPAVSKH